MAIKYLSPNTVAGVYTRYVKVFYDDVANKVNNGNELVISELRNWAHG